MSTVTRITTQQQAPPIAMTSAWMIGYMDGIAVKDFLYLPHPDEVQWCVGTVSKDRKRCTALAYTDSRTVYEVLDAAGVEWHTGVTVHDGRTVVVHLSIDGITRSAVGVVDDAMAAESRAVKRAAMQHGVGQLRRRRHFLGD